MLVGGDRLGLVRVCPVDAHATRHAVDVDGLAFSVSIHCFATLMFGKMVVPHTAGCVTWNTRLILMIVCRRKFRRRGFLFSLVVGVGWLLKLLPWFNRHGVGVVVQSLDAHSGPFRCEWARYGQRPIAPAGYRDDCIAYARPALFGHRRSCARPSRSAPDVPAFDRRKISARNGRCWRSEKSDVRAAFSLSLGKKSDDGRCLSVGLFPLSDVALCGDRRSDSDRVNAGADLELGRSSAAVIITSPLLSSAAVMLMSFMVVVFWLVVEVAGRFVFERSGDVLSMWFVDFDAVEFAANSWPACAACIHSSPSDLSVVRPFARFNCVSLPRSSLVKLVFPPLYGEPDPCRNLPPRL